MPCNKLEFWFVCLGLSSHNCWLCSTTDAVSSEQLYGILLPHLQISSWWWRFGCHWPCSCDISSRAYNLWIWVSVLMASPFHVSIPLVTIAFSLQNLGHQMDFVHPSLNPNISRLWRSPGGVQITMRLCHRCCSQTNVSINWQQVMLIFKLVECSILPSSITPIHPCNSPHHPMMMMMVEKSMHAVFWLR